MSDFEQKYYKLLERVAEMRKWQKDYQRCKASATFTKQKACEKRVDDEIISEIAKVESVQRKMFG